MTLTRIGDWEDIEKRLEDPHDALCLPVPSSASQKEAINILDEDHVAPLENKDIWILALVLDMAKKVHEEMAARGDPVDAVRYLLSNKICIHTIRREDLMRLAAVAGLVGVEVKELPSASVTSPLSDPWTSQKKSYIHQTKVSHRSCPTRKDRSSKKRVPITREMVLEQNGPILRELERFFGHQLEALLPFPKKLVELVVDPNNEDLLLVGTFGRIIQFKWNVSTQSMDIVQMKRGLNLEALDGMKTLKRHRIVAAALAEYMGIEYDTSDEVDHMVKQAGTEVPDERMWMLRWCSKYLNQFNKMDLGNSDEYGRGVSFKMTKGVPVFEARIRYEYKSFMTKVFCDNRGKDDTRALEAARKERRKMMAYVRSQTPL